MSDFTIKRVVANTAYARNGNAHNPTVTYRYQVWSGGQMIDSFKTWREANELVDRLRQSR